LTTRATIRSSAEFEEELSRYLFERSEESRAVRVGEKEISEQAAIVARYADLFSRDQLDALHTEEDAAGDEEERERLYRLRKTCEGGIVAAELAERADELENAILAARVEFRSETFPLRTALASLAVLEDYADPTSSARSTGRRRPRSTSSGSTCCLPTRTWTRISAASPIRSRGTRRRSRSRCATSRPSSCRRARR